MTIVWNFEKMTTGLSEIDDQHKEWKHRFNEFDNAIVNRKGQDALQSAIRYFEQYTETHFAREEACMTQYHCSAQTANRAAHDGFRAKLSEIKDCVEQEGATMVEAMALELSLEEWLVNHICTIDVQLRNVVSS